MHLSDHFHVFFYTSTYLSTESQNTSLSFVFPIVFLSILLWLVEQPLGKKKKNLGGILWDSAEESEPN